MLKQFLTSGILVQFVLDAFFGSARSTKCSGEDACDGSGCRSWHDNFQGLAVRDVRQSTAADRSWSAASISPATCRDNILIFGAQFVGARPVEFDEGWCDAPRHVAAPGSQSG